MIASLYGNHLGPVAGVTAALDASAGIATVGISIAYNGLRSNSNTLPVVPVFPSLFTTPGGLVAALNQDGSVNSSAHPAPVGSVISVFGTGGGQTLPPETDGTLFSGPLPQLQVPVQAQIQYYSGNGYSPVSAPVLGTINLSWWSASEAPRRAALSPRSE